MDNNIQHSEHTGWYLLKIFSNAILSCDQAALRTLLPVRPSVCDTFFTMTLSSDPHHFQEFLPLTKWCPCQRSRSEAKGQGYRGQNKFYPNLAVCELYLQFEFINGYEMMHKAWSSIEEVPYRFSRSSIKFRGQTIFQDHLSSLKFVQDKQSPILTRIGRFRTVNPVWIDQWLWNDTRSLK